MVKEGDNKIFWRGKRVFITGHTGFKGSWLSLVLQFLEADVYGFSLPPPTTLNLFTLGHVADGMTSIIGDIRDETALREALKKCAPDVVIHMAAQPLVRYSYQNPVETYHTNVLGTVHLFEAVRQVDTVKAIVNVTTDKCYENKEWHWGYRESDRLGGYDPYSNSKACSELVTSAYRNSYFHSSSGVGLASARAGNVIGGGDWAQDRLVPDVMMGCIHRQAISIRYPAALRPWQHVLEPLNGYLLLAQRLYESPSAYADSWNFGPNEEDIKPVSWVTAYLIKHWNERMNTKVNWSSHEGQHVHEATLLKLDCAKAKSRLRWDVRWNLEKGLNETLAWYQAFAATESMHAVTMAQIKEFLSS